MKLLPIQHSLLLAFIIFFIPAKAQHGTVKSMQKISATQGNFNASLYPENWIGYGISRLGDLNNDGVDDLAMGAIHDNDGGHWRGAVYILFMNANKTVNTYQKISDTQGNWGGVVNDDDRWGHKIMNWGDMNGDGNTDIIVSSTYHEDGGVVGAGALWVLFLNSNGTVISDQKISGTSGAGFSNAANTDDRFGTSLVSMGDLNGDGVTDIAVGEPGDDDVTDKGAIWLLNMNANGTVLSQQKISATSSNFPNVTTSGFSFAVGIDSLGDLDGDGNMDLVVGDRLDNDGGTERGAVWILFLNNNGTIKSSQKISDTQGNFTGVLSDQDRFGVDVTTLGDIDGDGVNDIAVGTYLDDDGGSDRGAVWILFLNTNGTVKSHQKISATQGGFTNTLDDDDHIGWGVKNIGDFDGDGVADLAVGATGDDDGGTNNGAQYILCVNGVGCTPTSSNISETVCDSLIAPSGSVLTTTGIHTDIISNTVGCDSIITINLTVNNSNQVTITETACNEYTAPSGAIYHSSGVYEDTIPTNAGCDSAITINLTINNLNYSIIQINSTLTAKAAGSKFQWLDCENNYTPIPGATDSIYQATANGSYAVIMTASECVDTSDCFDVTLNGILENNSLYPEFTIFPNPTLGIFTLQANHSNFDMYNTTLSVMSITGSQLYQLPLQGFISQDLEIDLQSGIYFVNIMRDNELLFKEKLIIIR